MSALAFAPRGPGHIMCGCLAVAAGMPGFLSCTADTDKLARAGPAPPRPSVGHRRSRTQAARHRLTSEYWTTDVFDEPALPEVVPPADRMVSVSDEFGVNETDSLYVRAEDMTCRAMPDRTSLRVRWRRRADTGALAGVGSSVSWDDEGGAGFALWYDRGWRLGRVRDLRIRMQGGRSIAEAWGLRTEGRAEMALGRTTAARVRGWFFGEDSGRRAGLGEVALAQYLGRGSALHASARGYQDSGGGEGRKRSTVTFVELRNESLKGTLLRASYRWYGDSEGVRAEGPSVGFEQYLEDWSFGVSYRRYRTSEGVDAGTWRLALKIEF